MAPKIRASHTQKLRGVIAGGAGSREFGFQNQYRTTLNSLENDRIGRVVKDDRTSSSKQECEERSSTSKNSTDEGEDRRKAVHDKRIHTRGKEAAAVKYSLVVPMGSGHAKSGHMSARGVIFNESIQEVAS